MLKKYNLGKIFGIILLVLAIEIIVFVFCLAK